MIKFLFSVFLAVSFTNYAFSSLSIFDSNDKVVYGEDDRTEVVNAANPLYSHLAQSTSSMISKSYLSLENDTYQIMFNPPSLGQKMNLCEDEKYRDQTAIAYCSGFLVGEDIIVTAGHCFQDAKNCENYLWVFEYWIDASGDSPKSIHQSNVYKCSEIIAQEYKRGSSNRDYAVIKLDRKVTGREPLEFRVDGKVADHQALFVIGNPSGIPTKVADNAKIKKNDNKEYFSANLDTFAGNSGSAVFNSDTGVVEGILVRGQQDYEYDHNSRCYRVNYLKDDNYRGEDVTRITQPDVLKLMSVQ